LVGICPPFIQSRLGLTLRNLRFLLLFCENGENIRTLQKTYIFFWYGFPLPRGVAACFAGEMLKNLSFWKMSGRSQKRPKDLILGYFAGKKLFHIDHLVNRKLYSAQSVVQYILMTTCCLFSAK
jgi:hypothetical protein